MSAAPVARWLGSDPSPPAGHRRQRAWLACIQDGSAITWTGGTHRQHGPALAEAEAELQRQQPAPKAESFS
jgi:hypothetical protein